MEPEILAYILSEWSNDKACSGILLCGSYAYGMPTEHSDIDLRIVFDNTSGKTHRAGVTTFRKKTIAFREDTEYVFYQTMHLGIHQTNRFQARNFALGKILYEKDQCLQYLKKEAHFLMKKKFPELNKDKIKYLLYKIWYDYDKIDCLPESDPFYVLNYYHALEETLKNYSEIIRTEIISRHKLSAFLFSTTFTDAYQITSFPDREFIELWTKAVNTINKTSYQELYVYIIGNYPGIDVKNFRISMINN